MNVLPVYSCKVLVACKPMQTTCLSKIHLVKKKKSVNSFYCRLYLAWVSLVAKLVKNLPAMQETWVRSLGWEDSPQGGHGNSLQYSCLENPHGQRSLMDYSPRSHSVRYD